MKKCAQVIKEPASLPCPQLQLLIPCSSCHLTPVLTELSLFPNTFVAELFEGLDHATTRFSHKTTQSVWKIIYQPIVT